MNSHNYCLPLPSQKVHEIMKKDPFFSLLRYALGITGELQEHFSNEQWQEIFDTAAEQTIVGTLYEGVKRLPPEQQPKDRQQIFAWHNTSEAISERARLCIAEYDRQADGQHYHNPQHLPEVRQDGCLDTLGHRIGQRYEGEGKRRTEEREATQLMQDGSTCQQLDGKAQRLESKRFHKVEVVCTVGILLTDER